MKYFYLGYTERAHIKRSVGAMVPAGIGLGTPGQLFQFNEIKCNINDHSKILYQKVIFEKLKNW